jgi:hypothetical protein
MSKIKVADLKTKQPTHDSDSNGCPTEQEIAARAYAIFLERGATDGHDLEDWLQAERELVEAD